MLSKLKPVLAVLLALFVCGASLQSVVCELSCGLEAQGTNCHMAASSQPEAIQAMPHGHCSPARQAAVDKGKDTSVSSRHPAGCGHSVSPAIENSVGSKSVFAVLQWSLFKAASAEPFTPHHTALPHRRPPPLLASVTPRLINLRV